MGASANATVAGALGAENALDASANNGARGNFQIRTRGMYGDSARDRLKMPDATKLPPLQFGISSGGGSVGGANSMAVGGVVSASAAAASALGPCSPRTVTKSSTRIDDFDALFSAAQLTPREKYATPQTAMQEIGWWNKPLISHRELEPRFRYGLGSCDITKNGSQFVGSRRK